VVKTLELVVEVSKMEIELAIVGVVLYVMEEILVACGEMEMTFKVGFSEVEEGPTTVTMTVYESVEVEMTAMEVTLYEFVEAGFAMVAVTLGESVEVEVGMKMMERTLHESVEVALGFTTMA